MRLELKQKNKKHLPCCKIRVFKPIYFTPKYRRKIIYYELREDIQKIIKDLCKWKGIEIIEGHMMSDHVHLLVEIPPKLSVSSFMGYLKGKSAMMIFNRHANLK